jgi:pyruvate dehydrogenase E2 component (dihydrolipoamide acetyltransferase)
MAQVEVTMPKMGESITEGTIIAWHKEPGDTIEQDETLLEIGTDKVDTDVPSPAGGVLKEILVAEGDTVDVGTAIALIETDVDAAASSTPSEAPAQPAQAEKEESKAEPEPAVQSEAPSHEAPSEQKGEIEVVMPKMGESITEGTIIAWRKQVGEAIELDEALLEIGTDKVDTEVPSPSAGILKEIRAEEGETVEVGAVIAVLATEAGASVPATSGDGAPAAQPAAEAPAKEQARPAAPASARAADAPGGDRPADTTISRKGSDGRFFSPLVRSIAETEGLTMQELESIQGSGRDGRVTKKDVLAYLETRSTQAAPAAAPAVAAGPTAPAQGRTVDVSGGYDGRVEIIEMDRMRQIIADHMIRSKSTSAHVTSFAEADVTNLVRFREKNKEAFLKREGMKLTFTPFFVMAAVEALKEHPILNASVEERRIIIKKDLHIGIAVAIGRTGLVAPVIRDAGAKNLVGLARAANDMAERARNKKLQPDEIQGGTFTVTNIGSLGSIMGTPIINQPQVAILATGAIKKRPMVIEDPKVGDVIAIRHMMNLSLSYDHRIIDGAMGASFLQKYVSVLEGIDPDGEI